MKSEALRDTQLGAAIQQATSGDVLPIASLSQDKHSSIVFHVDRSKAFSNIIQRVLCEGEKYGHKAARKEGMRVVVNPVDVQACGEGEESQSPPSLSQLRAAVLLKHVLRLLSANGYQTQTAKFPVTSDVQDLLSALNLDIGTCRKEVIGDLCGPLVLRAEASPSRETLQVAETEGDGSSDKDKRQCLVMNLRSFMTSAGVAVGKTGYDKNLNLVDVRLEDGTLSDTVRKAAVVELIMSDKQEWSGSATLCVHLTSQSLAYTQQQADLLWQSCTQYNVSNLVQRHLVFGTIAGRKSSDSAAMDAREFYNVRHRQMTQAAMMKYGDHDQGDVWDDMVHTLTLASLTFDLLTTTCSSQVHVDLSEEEGDNRSGPFVLYNCARLASLLSSFEQQVEQGTYPPLPAPQHVNFQLLREEEEWTLALLYIHDFPDLVQDTLHHWDTQHGITAHIHTHKVSHFLLNFSKTLSSYYSRYHILGGSEAHLLPLMYARLSLMKAAHRVLCNGLHLLGLEPLARL
ncbi:DALR anticodon-binding domain-containing protein 3-like [Babylonia areolata]|uniref:DALR anticodon-binding domain-containing protein 3-like n=1 Tax=Babylonia areolata TaxID=304850 RepID=UPI003FD2FBD9